MTTPPLTVSGILFFFKQYTLYGVYRSPQDIEEWLTEKLTTFSHQERALGATEERNRIYDVLLGKFPEFSEQEIIALLAPTQNE